MTNNSPAGELDHRRRLLVLAICCFSIFVVVMDISIVNVALPAIREDLHSSISGLQWTVDAYTLVLAGFLLAAGSTADRFGRRRMFKLGLGVFGLGSLACSLAPSAGWLVAARAVQALGGTMLNPVAMAIVATTFPERSERARAIGIFGAVSGLSLALGPILGGALVDGFGWRSVFLVNVPVVAVAIVCTAAFVPESRAPRPRRFDPVGHLLVVLALGSLVYAIKESGRSGWASTAVLTPLAVFLAATLSVLAYEPHRTDPLVELRFFRSIPFSSSILMALIALCGFSSFLFVTMLYLETVRGMSALAAGLSFLPVGILIVALSPQSGRIVATRGPRLPLMISGAAMALGGVVSLRLLPSTPLPVVLAAYLLFGVALGAVNPPVSTTAVSGMPVSMSGAAASMASAGRHTGTTLGVAIVGTIVGSTAAPGARAFTDAEHGVWVMVTGLGVALICLAWLSTGRRAMESATRAAARFDDLDRVPQRQPADAG
jgi:EmrB/QacA subfamily drug resistance transporter